MDYLSDIWDSVTSFLRTIRDYLGDVILKTLGLGLACLLILLNWDVFDILPSIWCCIRIVLLCFLRLLCILAGLFYLIYLMYSSVPESCGEKPRQNTSMQASPTTSEPEPPAISESVPKIRISPPEETAEASLAKDDADPENNLQSEDKAVDAKVEELSEQAEGTTQTDCVEETQTDLRAVPSDMGPKARSLGIQSPSAKTENCDMSPAGRRMKPPQDGRCGGCGGQQQAIWPIPSCCASCLCCMQAAQFAAAAARACSPDPCFSPPLNAAPPYPCYFCLNRAPNAQPENEPCRGAQPIPQESEEFHEEFWERFPTVKHSIDTQEIWKQSTPKPNGEKGHDPKVAAWLRQDEQSEKNKSDKMKAPSSSKDTSASAPMVDAVKTSFQGTDGKGRSGSVTGGKK